MQQGFTRGFRIGKPSLFAWHVARTEDTIQLERSCEKMEGKKNDARKDGERNPQTPMVSKVAQQAEHYALSNSKCCWQAGWLLAGEGLSASLPQIQTSHIVDICNGTIQHPCSPHGTSPSHTINKRACSFYRECNIFLYSNPHTIHLLFSISETDALWEGMMLLSALRCGFIWLCNLKKSILKKKRSNDINTGRSGYFTMPKMPPKTQCNILQSFIDLLAHLFTTFWIYFST